MQKNYGVIRNLILTLIAIFTLPTQVQANCDHIVKLHNKKKITLDGRSGYVSQNHDVDPRTFQPGDVVCIDGISNAKMLRIYNLDGAPGNPIIFRNEGGQVHFGIAVSGANVLMKNSRYLKFEGSFDGSTYGFHIAPSSGRSDKGIRMESRTTDVEISGFEIENTKIGISVSTKSNCSDAQLAISGSGTEMYDYDNDGQSYGDLNDITTADNFVMENYTIHHNYIHDIRDEGMYLGTNRSFPMYGPNGEQGDANGGATICQNGQGLTTMDPDYYVYNDPRNPKMQGLSVYEVRIERTGREAINIKSIIDSCNVYDNIIKEDTLDNELWQRGGINLQFPVRCDVYRNIVIDGHGPGIFTSGAGGEIANNLIVRAGQVGSINARGVFLRSPDYVEGRDTFPFSEDYRPLYDASRFIVENNTIISPDAEAIDFEVDYGSSHVIRNNLMADALVGIEENANVSSYSNTLFADLTTPDFVDAATDNYRLNSTSPAKDEGSTPEGTKVMISDLDGNPRVSGSAIDLGSFEVQ